MSILYFFSGMLTMYFLIYFFKTLLILQTFKITEYKLLLISLSLLQYKYHAIQILEIAYDKAIEENKDLENEKIKVIEKIHEKFSSFGDEWIKNLKNILPFQTQYNNWKEAVDYADKLINNKR